MKKEKEELRAMLNEYISMSLADRSNHWIRRFYRCFIDGSYKHNNSGHEGYDNNIEFITHLVGYYSEKQYYIKMRSKVIQYFTDFLSVEFSTLSRSTIHNTLVGFFGDSIEVFNQQLMDDFCNLIEKDLSDFFSPELLASKRGL